MFGLDVIFFPLGAAVYFNPILSSSMLTWSDLYLPIPKPRLFLFSALIFLCELITTLLLLFYYD